MAEPRSYNVACCIWGALVLAAALALLLWPMLSERFAREVDRVEQIDEFAE